MFFGKYYINLDFWCLKPMSLLLLRVCKHPSPPKNKLDPDGVFPIAKLPAPFLGIKSLIHGALTEFSPRVTWAPKCWEAEMGPTNRLFQGPKSRLVGEMGWFHLARWWRIILLKCVCMFLFVGDFQSNVFCSCSTSTVSSIAWHLYLTFGVAILFNICTWKTLRWVWPMNLYAWDTHE